MLGEEGSVSAFSEDVGGHNIVDTVIGKAALEGIEFMRTLLVSTWRLTFEIAIKSVNAGVPVVSISALTDKGIRMAEMAGLTLIGFVRRRRFNV